MAKRQVEVFTAGCPVCEPTVRLVRETACSDCEVTVYDLNVEGADRARQYAVKTVPAVAVNGSLLPCCENQGVSAEELEAAGVGLRIGS
ncbi:hypothetical protein BH23ACT12_BH23ACT12_06390 [soil metagenome]